MSEANLTLAKLVGETLVRIERHGNERLDFVTTTGAVLSMYHSQDCCENVEIESIAGSLDDLVGSPIIVAEERTSNDRPFGVIRDYEPESETWTFYTLRTNKGACDIRWHGTSNGYYSESVYTSWEGGRPTAIIDRAEATIADIEQHGNMAVSQNELLTTMRNLVALLRLRTKGD